MAENKINIRYLDWGDWPLDDKDILSALALMNHLQIACNDRVIRDSQIVLNMAETFLSLLKRAPHQADFSMVLKPITDEAATKAISASKRAIAQSKNKNPRDWVLLEWAKRPDQGQSKAAFARQYAPLVRIRDNVIVNPDTIARDWLPKREKKPAE